MFFSACRSFGGIVFPLFFALCMIPLQAFGLKKNLEGMFVVCNTSDKKHSSTTLGDSKVFAVQSSPAQLIPEFFHCLEEGSKVFSSVAGKDTRNIFPDEICWANC